MKNFIFLCLLFSACHKDNPTPIPNTNIPSQQVTMKITNCEYIICGWYLSNPNPSYTYAVASPGTKWGFTLNAPTNASICDTTIIIQEGFSIECESVANGPGNKVSVLSMTVNGITYSDTCNASHPSYDLKIPYILVQ